MKLLMFYTHEWWYRTASKGLPGPDVAPDPAAPDIRREESLSGAVAVFFHVEARDEDEDDREGVARKFVKNVKWIAGKFGTKNVVLHSFNHLGASKSSPEFALALADEVEGRLRGAGFTVQRTPFGYFSEFLMHVAGDSLAKVFKEF